MFYSFLAVLLFAGLPGRPAWADEFKLANGNTLRGTLADANEDGIVVKLDVGGFAAREPWINLSQETLKRLAQNPQYVSLADPFIELDPEELRAREKEKEIVVREVETRMERPIPRPGLLTAFVNPVGLLILAMLMAANLYAAFEIALFRQQPVALVCGLAVVLPVLVPLVFLCLPTRSASARDESAGEGAETGPAALATSSFAGQGQMPASSLALAAAGKKKEAADPTAQVYTRGEFTFNRRFFETKFPGFFRVVPGEAEKDLVLVIKAVRNQYVAKRISRISSNEMHVQLLSTDNKGATEVAIQFAEVHSVQVRHKDAKTQA